MNLSYYHYFASHTVNGEFKDGSDTEVPAMVMHASGNFGKCDVKIKSLEIQADLEP